MLPQEQVLQTMAQLVDEGLLAVARGADYTRRVEVLGGRPRNVKCGRIHPHHQRVRRVDRWAHRARGVGSAEWERSKLGHFAHSTLRLSAAYRAS